MLTVWVPYDAKVTVNGLETKSTGSRRQFVSYGLKPGLSYKYVVKAEVVRNGQTVEDTRTVTLTAGQITAVAFGFNLTPPEQVAASLSSRDFAHGFRPKSPDDRATATIDVQTTSPRDRIRAGAGAFFIAPVGRRQRPICR